MIKNCPRCNHDKNTKDGIVAQKQRYKCKKCNYRFTVIQKRTSASKETKKMALQLYLEGLGFRSIGRILNFSHVAVYEWIKSFGEEVTLLQTQGKSPQVMEIDEMHSYIGCKKNLAGYGLLLIDMEKDLSILTLVNEIPSQEKSYGTRLNT